MRDFYEILGVDKHASEQEIKKAYRRAAKKHHPDLNPGDEKSETFFKEINLAYEVLSDETKRRNYDLYGEDSLKEGFQSGGFGGFGDIFGDIFDIFGGGFSGNYSSSRANVPRQGEDIRADVTLEFKEAIFGTEKEITVRRQEECEQCHGEGTEPGTSKHKCGNCNGTGQVREASQSPFGRVVRVVPCSSCHGTGEIIEEPCNHCHGSGRQIFSRKVKVNIPAGVDNKSIISLRGEGHHGENGGIPGDLYIYISVKEDSIFQRRGTDILLEMPISYVDAVLGAEIQVPTLESIKKFQIPPGTQGGELFKMEGEGVPYLQRKGRGDLYFRTEIIVPKKVNGKQRELLEELRNESGHPVKEERKGFFNRFKDWFEDIS
ncbi:MAG: molecular chaperone DnaJ [Tissierellia bacterium]|nr:molecular chaperone DnaJ [Tissierellia bacterium]